MSWLTAVNHADRRKEIDIKRLLARPRGIPLSVLTAWNVMRPVHDLEAAGEGWVWLDKRKTTRFKLGSDGKVVEAERDGARAEWVSCDDVEKGLPEGKRAIYWARPGTTLKTVILAVHKAAIAPVAIFDTEDRFIGSVGVRDVLAAVLKRQG